MRRLTLAALAALAATFVVPAFASPSPSLAGPARTFFDDTIAGTGSWNSVLGWGSTGQATSTPTPLAGIVLGDRSLTAGLETGRSTRRPSDIFLTPPIDGTVVDLFALQDGSPHPAVDLATAGIAVTRS